jgi:hypothetical protein
MRFHSCPTVLENLAETILQIRSSFKTMPTPNTPTSIIPPNIKLKQETKGVATMDLR